MRLRALSAGISAPLARFDGQVHSVFDTACNLSLDDGLLITLLTLAQGNLPQGIRIELSPGLTFHQIGLTPGQPLTARDGNLYIVDAQLEVELWFARRWHIDLSALQAELAQPPAQAAWSAAYQQLQEQRSALSGEGLAALGWQPDGRQGSLVLATDASQVAQRAFPALNSLLQATRAYDAGMLLDALQALVGLGPGLTPSGDDYLVGYLTGLWSTINSHLAQPARFIEALGASLQEMAPRTNQISNTYLQHAAQGRVSQPLATLARAIARGSDLQIIQEATQVAVQIGSTSGADGVLGLLVGLSVWQTNTIPQSS